MASITEQSRQSPVSEFINHVQVYVQEDSMKLTPVNVRIRSSPNDKLDKVVFRHRIERKSRFNDTAPVLVSCVNYISTL